MDEHWFRLNLTSAGDRLKGSGSGGHASEAEAAELSPSVRRGRQRRNASALRLSPVLFAPLIPTWGWVQPGILIY